MREILFKAKRLDNGEWVCGFLVPMWGQMHIIDRDFENTAYPIDESTICQYTGLNARNGNRIWENDIISIYTYDYMEPKEVFFGKVVYLDAWACWCIQQPDDEKPIPLCECEGSYQTDRFVEGNIFDNPDMLRSAYYW